MPEECSNRRFICNRNDALWIVALEADRPGVPWHHWLTLKIHTCPIRLCLSLLLCVRLNSSQKLIARPGVLDVFDAEVDTLLDVTVADLLVEDDADSGLGNVVDDAGFAVVDLVRHALLNCTVTDYIHNVSDLVLPEVDGERNGTSLFEAAREGIASAGAETCCVTHCVRILVLDRIEGGVVE